MKWREHRRGEGRKRKNRISDAMLRQYRSLVKELLPSKGRLTPTFGTNFCKDQSLL